MWPLLYIFIIALILLIPIPSLIIDLNLKEVFKTRYSRGQNLYNQLISLGFSGEGHNLTNYKFFDGLVYDILEQVKLYGASPRSLLSSLKSSLLKELEFERKSSKLVTSSYIQFILASLMTLSFSLFSMHVLEVKISFSSFSVQIIWQLIGVFTFKLAVKRVQSRLFGNIDRSIFSIYSASLFFKVGMPVSEVITKSNLKTFFEIKDKKLTHFQNRVKKLIDARQRYGIELEEEFNYLIEEVWNFYNTNCETMQNSLKVIKFLWMGLFFFTAYLYSVFQIIQSFGLH